MINLQNSFDQLTALKETGKSRIYRAIRRRDNVSVILKLIGSDDQYDQNLRSLQNEFSLASRVNGNGVIRPLEILQSKEGCVLVLEDIGGLALREILAQGKIPDLATVLRLAIRIADSLDHIHQNEIIHKDINPGNIIVNPVDWEARITDFGISTGLSREMQALVPPDRLEGTLAYISPEQTGRMNRFVDYRTDLYSFGITFYEMLCGILPFEAADPISWVHCHIAQKPVPPNERNPQIPAALADITLKLLAKNAEDRYASAAGFKHDLVKCLDMLTATGTIRDFSTGEMDWSGRFQIPQKLYGREREITRLLDAFSAAAAGRSQLMLVAGYSGVGKSSLIHEVHRPIIERRGYFIAGKFDQFQRNIPYFAVIQAFRNLTDQIIAESPDRLARWRDLLLEALGPNGQMIIDVIPEIQILIGKQPPIATMGPGEAQTRFFTTFRKFISVFATEDHPLTMFLDDLQWADSASLSLIQTLLTEQDSKHLFLIGAYRDNEVDLSHPLSLMINEIKKEGAVIETLSLPPLEARFVAEIIAETLKKEGGSTGELTATVFEKTQGNPFFISEFLKTLYQDGLLRFDAAGRAWTWNIEDIAARGFTDNVVDLMISKLRKRSEKEQLLLNRGACVGHHFDLKTLAIVCEETPEETIVSLRELVKEGFLVPRSGSIEIMRDSGSKDRKFTVEESAGAVFVFQHDRVQQAAYELVPENQRMELHLKIGRLLLNNYKKEKREEDVFSIIEHLNGSRALISDAAEKLELAGLNLTAGEKAIQNTAYRAAIETLTIARGLLPADGWESLYSLALPVHEKLFIALSLAGNHSEAGALYDLVIARVHEADRYPFYLEQMRSFVATGQFTRNIDLGIEALGNLGIELPGQMDQENIGLSFQLELGLFQNNMKDGDIEKLADLPETRDEKIILTMDILMNMLDAAFFGNPGLLPLIIMKFVNITLKHGNSPIASLAYAWTGVPLIYVLEQYGEAHRFGKLAIQLAHKFGNTFMLSRAYVLLGAFTGAWGDPMENIIVALKKAFQYGSESGDINFSVYAASLYNRWAFFKGHRLPEVAEEAITSLHFMKKVNNQPIYEFHNFMLAGIRSLQGLSPAYDLLAETREAETAAFEKWQSIPLHMSLFSILKLMFHVIFADFRQAESFGRMARQYLFGLKPAYDFIHIPFYHALALFGLWEDASAEEREEYSKTTLDSLRELKMWADLCPDNFSQKYFLVLAEQARVQGDLQSCIKLYDDAIAAAARNGFLADEALANDFCARFWLARGNEKIGAVYLNEAVKLYRVWGALARVKDLEGRHGHLLKPASLPAGISGTDSSTTTRSRLSLRSSSTGSSSLHGAGSLDLGSVLKASRALASEIRLDTLLTRLMDIVLENAGARRGFLLLERDGQLHIAAIADLDTGENGSLDLPLSESEEEGPQLAVSVVRYASRAQKSIVIADALADERFSRDPYFSRNRTRSVLCAPIQNQGRLVGVLYLENNLTPGAFTPSSLEVLELLTSQIAISLENALLYASLEEKVQERTVELRASKKEIDDIMANVRQGLLTVGPDRTINGEYSRKVSAIFEREISGVKFTQLFAATPDRVGIIEDFLDQLFTNPFMSDLLFERANPVKVYRFPIVREEGTEVSKVLSFGFSRIFSHEGSTRSVQKVMVVIDDRTEEFALKEELEQKAKEQAIRVEKLYQILQLQPGVFSDFIRESAETLDEVFSGLRQLGDDPGQDREILHRCFRNVHTLKGNARSLNLDSIGTTAHELEDLFSELRDQPDRFSGKLKEKMILALDSLNNELKDGNSLFEKILNMQSSLQSKSMDAMSEFEERLRKIVDKESSILKKKIDFRYQRDLDTIEGAVLMKLRNPLSHIIRNAIAHGIESPEERERLGKPEDGRILLGISLTDGHLMITCEDDGSGLNTERIRQKAVEMNLIAREQSRTMQDKEVHRLIFTSGLSTADQVNEMSGRGVGMDAVREDLKKLGATIFLSTKPQKYTRFTIKVPYVDKN